MAQLLSRQFNSEDKSRRFIILIIGDLLVFFVFMIIGRSTHNLSVADFDALVSMAPYLIAWFLVMPWFGLFRLDVATSLSKMWYRLLLGWGLIGGPLSILLWAIFRGRAIPSGIVPTFAYVTIGVTLALALLWRIGYALFMTYSATKSGQGTA